MATWKSQGGAEHMVALPPPFPWEATLTLTFLFTASMPPLPCNENPNSSDHCAPTEWKNALTLAEKRAGKNAPEGTLCTGLRGLGRVHKQMQNEDPGFQTPSVSGPLFFSELVFAS